jgi:hypothetical protein
MKKKRPHKRCRQRSKNLPNNFRIEKQSEKGEVKLTGEK